MKKVRIKLQTKITLLIIGIVFISIFSTMFFTNRWVNNNLQREIEKNMMNIAQMISKSPNVIDGLKSKDTNIIQPHIRAVLDSTSEIDMIVVADMNGIRYAHPFEDRIGQMFVGGDELRVLQNGDSYISDATGTLGRSVRAFAPVYNAEAQQLGFVMAGTLTQSISKTKKQRTYTVVLSSFIGLFLGGIGAFTLARNVKKILLGLEPEQISQMYIQKKIMLDTIHEGIIAVDQNSRITLVNNSAIKLLSIEEENIIGKHVKEIFPTSRLPHVFETGNAEYDREQVINNTIIITNRVPIMNGQKRVGAIATFRDKTNVIRLAEELTGVRQVVDGLRANTHEFMNKLHVVLGLIELGDLEEAKRYIVNVRDTQQQVMNSIINKIKDPTVAGLMLGKFSRAKELGIHLILEEDSFLKKRTDKIDNHRLLTIIGNLLENAMEAVAPKSIVGKNVNIKIKESSPEIEIIVQDTGIGIRGEDLPHIFNRGFSTKEGSGGIGLALSSEAIKSLNGSMKIESQIGEGTKFIVTIPKEENYDKDSDC